MTYLRVIYEKKMLHVYGDSFSSVQTISFFVEQKLGIGVSNMQAKCFKAITLKTRGGDEWGKKQR